MFKNVFRYFLFEIKVIVSNKMPRNKKNIEKHFLHFNVLLSHYLMPHGKSEAGGFEFINCHFSLERIIFSLFPLYTIPTLAKLNIHHSDTVRTNNDFSEAVQCHV